VVIGDTMEVFLDSGVVIVTDNYTKAVIQPKFIQKDTTGAEEDLVVIGDTMEVFLDSGIVIVTNSVTIEKGRTRAVCQRAEYYKEDHKIILMEDPIIWQDKHRISGIEISLHLTEDDFKIQEIFVRQNALAVSLSNYNSTVDTLYNRISGKTLTMFIENDEIDHAIAEGNAVSIYYMSEEDTKHGVNEVSGPTIYLYFENRELKRFQVEGGIIGTFFPDKYKSRAKN